MVYRYMTMRGGAVRKNRNPTMYIYRVIFPEPFIFHNGCLSRPYLGKFKRDWNETRFI